MADLFAREDINKEKDRNLKRELQKPPASPFQPPAQPLGQPQAFPAPAPTQPQAPTSQPATMGTFDQDLKSQDPFQNKPPAPPDDFQKSVEAAVQQRLQGGAPEVEEQARLAQAENRKAQQAFAQEAKELNLQRFLPETGGFERAQTGFIQQQALERQNFEAKLAADKVSAIQEARDRATNQGIQLIGISAQERVADKDRESRETVAELDRGLAVLLEDKRIGAQFELQDMKQQFDELILDKGFANEKEMFGMKSELESKLMQMGIDAETARQLSDQTFRAFQADAQRQHEGTQADLDRKWQTGERIETEEFNKVMQTNQNIFDASQNELNRVLQLDLVDRRAAYEKSLQESNQKFQERLQSNEFTYDEAKLLLQHDFQLSLQANGFEQDEALQATRLQHDMDQAALDRNQQLLMFNAQMAQGDEQFLATLDISQQELDIQKQRLQNEIKELDQFLGDKDIQDVMGLVSIGMELSNGDEELMKPFADLLANTLNDKLGEKGIETTFDPTKILQGTGGDIIDELGGIGKTDEDFKAWLKTSDNGKITIEDQEATVTGAQESTRTFTTGTGDIQEGDQIIKIKVDGKELLYYPRLGIYSNTDKSVNSPYKIGKGWHFDYFRSLDDALNQNKENTIIATMKN